MKINSITKSTVHIVETDEPDFYVYTRHAADVWEIRMGESKESHWDCEKIEKLYQEKLAEDTQ